MGKTRKRKMRKRARLLEQLALLDSAASKEAPQEIAVTTIKIAPDETEKATIPVKVETETATPAGKKLETTTKKGKISSRKKRTAKSGKKK